MPDRFGRIRLRPASGLTLMLAASLGVAACARGTDERARVQADIAALRGDVEQLKNGQETAARERAKLGEQLKAVDAQQAFLVAETKASREELTRVQKSLEQSETAMREIRAAVEEIQRKAAEPPPTPTPAAKATPSSGPSEASAEKLYATAMASFRAEEHGQAVLELAEFVDRFPQHPQAPNAQYWIGEAYYRQRDFRQALAEFQKVVDGYPSAAQVPESLLKIGLCHRALKDPARARESWEQVTRAYPGTSAAAQARSLLSQLGAQGRGAR